MFRFFLHEPWRFELESLYLQAKLSYSLSHLHSPMVLSLKSIYSTHILLSITTHSVGCRHTQKTCGVPHAPERCIFWPCPNRTSSAPSHYLLQAPGRHGAPNSPVTHCLFPVLLINWQESSCQRTRPSRSRKAGHPPQT